VNEFLRKLFKRLLLSFIFSMFKFDVNLGFELFKFLLPKVDVELLVKQKVLFIFEYLYNLLVKLFDLRVFFFYEFFLFLGKLFCVLSILVYFLFGNLLPL
jgi:hypothetical protein